METTAIGYMRKPGEHYEIQWSTGVLVQVQSKKKKKSIQITRAEQQCVVSTKRTQNGILRADKKRGNEGVTELVCVFANYSLYFQIIQK